MSVQLKIKSKHLATEPAIIKHEIKRNGQNQSLANNLRQHLVDVVRPESRATHLARAFIAGRDYGEVERSRKIDNEYAFWFTVIPRVLKMVNKYHDRTVARKDIENWINK